MDELNHRVKNTLATVQSLAQQTARGTDSSEAFHQSFEGRLIALSHAHDQLTSRHWISADLRAIVIAAVAPYLSTRRERVAITGDDVTVMPRVALTLAMVLHELTTNAVKYGALSVAGGQVEVSWRLVQPPSQPALLWIEWRERGGPPVSAPKRRGFGSRFIEGSVKAELQGTARLHFDKAGLRCTMEVPHEIAVVVTDPELGRGENRTTRPLA